MTLCVSDLILVGAVRINNMDEVHKKALITQSFFAPRAGSRISGTTV